MDSSHVGPKESSTPPCDAHHDTSQSQAPTDPKCLRRKLGWLVASAVLEVATERAKIPVIDPTEFDPIAQVMSDGSASNLNGSETNTACASHALDSMFFDWTGWSPPVENVLRSSKIASPKDKKKLMESLMWIRQLEITIKQLLAMCVHTYKEWHFESSLHKASFLMTVMKFCLCTKETLLLHEETLKVRFNALQEVKSHLAGDDARDRAAWRDATGMTGRFDDQTHLWDNFLCNGVPAMRGMAGFFRPENSAITQVIPPSAQKIIADWTELFNNSSKEHHPTTNSAETESTDNFIYQHVNLRQNPFSRIATFPDLSVEHTPAHRSAYVAAKLFGEGMGDDNLTDDRDENWPPFLVRSSRPESDTGAN